MTIIKQEINTSIFRKNDIRGRVPEDLNFESVERIGKSFAKYVIDNTDKNPGDIWVSIGYDARLHSPMLSEGLISGITKSGVNVVDLEMCPTPLVYFSSFFLTDKCPMPDASIMITGSHNPPNYNGLKMCLGKDCLKSDNILQLKDFFVEQKLQDANQKGNVFKFDLVTPYIEYISNEFKNIIASKTALKVVVDSGNGCAGVLVPEILRNIGCEVIELYSEPDGNFPNHHPDPTVIKNLQELICKVAENKADLGVAYDGDVDRIGVVDNKGNVIPGDMLMLIFAMDIINSKKFENPVFISEVKCSQVLYDTLNSSGSNAIMWKTGHSFIKDKMKKENALLAGEMSGHIFFADRYYGYDDAIYATCRLVEFIAKNKATNANFSISGYLDNYPKMVATPEIRKPCPDERKFQVMEALKEKIFTIKPDNKDIKDVITIDGLRVVFNDGFGLVRASNTEPILVLRFEASTEENMFKNQKFIQTLIEDVMTA